MTETADRTSSYGTPAVSVCVITFVGPDYLARCLESLVPQAEAVGGEVLLPLDETGEEAARVATRWPGVRTLRLTGRRTPAELRARAVAESRAPVVALLEDHCVPDRSWLERMLAAHDGVRAAVGGTVEKGFPPGQDRDRALNWALYLTDYSRYMNPLPEGPVHSLTDTNVSYRREEVDRLAHLWATEFHENIVNDSLRAAGKELWLAPDVIVFEQRSVPLAGALRDRYSFGRLFASTRMAGRRPGQRLAYAGASLLMPPVLIARVGRNLFTRRRHRLQLVRALPALTLVTTVWMLGEFVGYLTGSPGTLTADTRVGESAPASGL